MIFKDDKFCKYFNFNNKVYINYVRMHILLELTINLLT